MILVLSASAGIDELLSDMIELRVKSEVDECAASRQDGGLGGAGGIADGGRALPSFKFWIKKTDVDRAAPACPPAYLPDACCCLLVPDQPVAFRVTTGPGWIGWKDTTASL